MTNAYLQFPQKYISNENKFTLENLEVNHLNSDDSRKKFLLNPMANFSSTLLNLMKSSKIEAFEGWMKYFRNIDLTHRQTFEECDQKTNLMLKICGLLPQTDLESVMPNEHTARILKILDDASIQSKTALKQSSETNFEYYFKNSELFNQFGFSKLNGCVLTETILQFAFEQINLSNLEFQKLIHEKNVEALKGILISNSQLV